MSNQQAPNPRPYMPPTPAEHRAAALVEIQAMHNENQRLKAAAEEDRRTIQMLNDRVALMTNQLRTCDIERKTAERKLIRLAGAMRNINLLTAEATVIMRDVSDLDEAETTANAPPREQQMLKAIEQEIAAKPPEGG